MKILLLVSHLWCGGGTETHVLTLAKRLKRAGHSVGVYTGGGPWLPIFRQLGIRVHQGPISVEHVLRCVKSNRYQIVHAHDNSTIPLLQSSRFRSIPLVITVHGLYFGCPVLQKLGRSSRAVIAVSPGVKQYLKECGIPDEKIEVIPNGVMTSRFRPRKSNCRKRLGIPKDAFVIGYAGRFTLMKGNLGMRLCRRLNRYAAQHGNVYVVVAGRDSEQAIASSKHLMVLGHVADMGDFYNACNVVIGTGRVAMESLSCGIPTLAIGESRYIGFITTRNLLDAALSNFGDHGASGGLWHSRELFSDLNRARKSSRWYRAEATELRRLLVGKYSATGMAQKVERVYRKCL